MEFPGAGEHATVLAFEPQIPAPRSTRGDGDEAVDRKSLYGQRSAVVRHHEGRASGRSEGELGFHGVAPEEVEGCELDGLQAAPWPAPVDHLGLEEADDGLSEGVVIGAADTADGGLDAGFSQTLGVFDRDVLDAPVTMVDELIPLERPPVMERLLQRVEDEPGLH